MAKFLCKIWNADRSKKKAFMCEGSIDLVIKKGKKLFHCSLSFNTIALLLFIFSKRVLS